MIRQATAMLALSTFLLSTAYLALSDTGKIQAWEVVNETQESEEQKERILEQAHEEIQSREKNISNVTEWKNFENRMEQIRIDTDPDQ